MFLTAYILKIKGIYFKKMKRGRRMKTVFLKRSGIVAVFICLLLIFCGVLYPPQDTAASGTGGKKPIYSVDTREKRVAISFDAAWGADKTLSIMDILDANNAKATFFLVGFWIEKYPELIKTMDERGFEVGNHSANHPRMSKLTKKQKELELKTVNDAIYNIISKRPTVFRPPFGDYDDQTVDCVNGLGMHCVQWSIDSLDWKDISCDEIVKRCTKNVKNGDIILMHNNSKYVLDALPKILASLKKQGFEVVSVSELIYNEDYYVDNNGVQHKTS